MDAGKDPYYMHYFRVNFDGTGLTRFTTADGTHTLSPNPRDWTAITQYYVDTYSRVDLPTVTRAAQGQRSVAGDAAREGRRRPSCWPPAGRMPEVFMSKAPRQPRRTSGASSSARRTSIRRRSIRSSKTSTPVRRARSCRRRGARRAACRRSPSSASSSFRSTAWARPTGRRRSMTWRSRTSATPGFPDRILWHKAIAAKYPCVRHHARRHLRHVGRRTELDGRRALPSGVLQGRRRHRTPAATTTAWTRSGGTSSGWAGRSVRTTRRRRTWSTRRSCKGRLAAHRAARWTRTSIRPRRCRS